MRAFVSHLVALNLALHAVLGCCWHHALLADEVSVQVEQTTPKTTHCGTCRCHRHQASQPVKPEPLPSVPSEPKDRAPDSCCGNCQGIAANRIQLDDPSDSHVFDLLPAAPFLDLSAATVALRQGPEVTPTGPPPLRLHLLFQLLLI